MKVKGEAVKGEAVKAVKPTKPMSEAEQVAAAFAAAAYDKWNGQKTPLPPKSAWKVADAKLAGAGEAAEAGKPVKAKLAGEAAEAGLKGMKVKAMGEAAEAGKKH